MVKQSAHLYIDPNAQFGYGIPDFALALNLNTTTFSSEEFVLYPNPTDSKVTIQFPNDFQKAEILLYNNLGQQVLNTQIENSNSSFSVENLTSGIYFYKITSANKSQTGKLVKS